MSEVNLKDNAEYAAALLWFITDKWWKDVEENKKNICVHTIMYFFRTTFVGLINELDQNKRIIGLEGDEKESEDYIVLSALGDFIHNAPNDSLLHFVVLYTCWLDWFIHRYGQDAAQKYDIVAPDSMDEQTKEKFAAYMIETLRTKAKDDFQLFIDGFLNGRFAKDAYKLVKAATQTINSRVEMMKKTD